MKYDTNYVVLFILISSVLICVSYIYFKKNKNKQNIESYQRTQTNLKNYRVIICGLARDCEKNLEKNLSAINDIRRNFGDNRVILIENDSKDKTGEICKKWADKNENVILVSEKMDEKIKQVNPYKFNDPVSRHRFFKMAYLRNIYMGIVRSLGWNTENDIMIIIDLDLASINPSNIVSVIDREKNNDWDLLCANGLTDYLCPKDKACVFNNGSHRYYDSLALRFIGQENEVFVSDESNDMDKVSKHFPNAWKIFKSPSDKPIKVHSCFGGLAIYRTNKIINLLYDEHDCEHISINKHLKNKYVLSDMIVFYD